MAAGGGGGKRAAGGGTNLRLAVPSEAPQTQPQETQPSLRRGGARRSEADNPRRGGVLLRAEGQHARPDNRMNSE